MQRFLDYLLCDRPTNELARLNKIWERFNEGHEVIDEILGHKWKYQKERVRLLIRFISIKGQI